MIGTGFLIEDFRAEFGVKEGDYYSPTLLNSYLIDLVESFKCTNCSVQKLIYVIYIDRNTGMILIYQQHLKNIQYALSILGNLN